VYEPGIFHVQFTKKSILYVWAWNYNLAYTLTYNFTIFYFDFPFAAMKCEFINDKRLVLGAQLPLLLGLLRALIIAARLVVKIRSLCSIIPAFISLNDRNKKGLGKNLKITFESQNGLCPPYL